LDCWKQVPAYDLGLQECGKGSHNRRKTVIEDHVDSTRAEMFRLAIQPVLTVRIRV
jgi:hypothetical protein